jgi:hypothetical protein
MSRKQTHCPTCGKPCEIAHMERVTVYLCPNGHRDEQHRLFPGGSQGLQLDIFGPTPEPTRSTPLQAGLFECKSAREEVLPCQ